MKTQDNERSVASVLAAAGYYPTDTTATRQDLQGQFVEEETVDIGGKSYTLSRISKYDVKLFADQLDKVCARDNPFIWDVYAKYAVHCLAAVRLANIQSKQGFRGVSAKGNELDFSRMNARQFFDPDALPARRTTWVRVVAAGTLAFLCDSTGAAIPLTIGEEECQIWLGWYNPATSPCSDMFQITLNTDLFDWQDMDFDRVDLEGGDVITEFKEPWILPPEEAGLINARYFVAGTDEMRPIGLWIKEAKNMRAMATP